MSLGRASWRYRIRVATARCTGKKTADVAINARVNASHSISNFVTALCGLACTMPLVFYGNAQSSSISLCNLLYSIGLDSTANHR